ncbi:MFS transporter [Micromonospora endophytica]|uniref:MFS transporter n=1 Tax=Micromonospora endophytica TaxID=515350 RepID=UPI003B8A9A8E
MSIAGLLPEIATDLDVSAGTAGQLITAFAFTFAFGAPVMAVLLDPLPRRRVLLAGLVVFAAANLAAAFAPRSGSCSGCGSPPASPRPPCRRRRSPPRARALRPESRAATWRRSPRA